MSLRIRLFLAMAALAAASVLVTALVTRGGVRRVVEAYGMRPPSLPGTEAREETDLTAALTRQWSADQHWEDAGPALDALTETTGQNLLLLDAEGRVAATRGVDPAMVRVASFDPPTDPVVEYASPQGSRRRLHGGTPLRTTDGAFAGVLIMIPKRGLDSLLATMGPQQDIDRRIATAALVAILLALLVALLIARHVAHPVTRLASATLQLARGDRSLRVVVNRTDELGQLGAAFNQLADSLERSEALRRRLIADVAHELRTPLTALQGQIEAMQDGLADLDPSGLDGLHDDVTRLAFLVAELQELALAEAEELHLDPGPVDLLDEARSAVRALNLHDKDHLQVTVAGDPVRVTADRVRLRQVISNLLSNAVTHSGGRSVQVAVSATEGGGRLSISDDGVGIAPEALEHIFERLYQVDTQGPGRVGSGLGLAISHELVRLHGGTIRVDSRLGEGTTFTIELPGAHDGVGRSS